MGRPKGTPKTGGRQKGTKNAARKAIQSGITPLSFMLAMLANEQADLADRKWAAKEAAPYVHPKLTSIDLGNKDGEAFKIVATQSDLGLL